MMSFALLLRTGIGELLPRVRKGGELLRWFPSLPRRGLGCGCREGSLRAAQ
jgi:hypothetical protein